MTKKPRPPSLKDPHLRKDIGEEICRMIDGGQDQKGSALHERWKDNEGRYRGEPDPQGLRLQEDDEPTAINIVKPRVDTLVTKVCNPLTSQRPYFSALGYADDRDRLKTNEEVVQMLYERAKYAKNLRTATRLSCMAAPAIFRCRHVRVLENELAGAPLVSVDLPRPFRYVGPLIEVFHPNDFVLYPLNSGGIEQARLCGHRFTRRVREVKEWQQLDKYFDTLTLYGGDDPQSWESGRSSSWSLTSENSGIFEADDMAIELWDVLVKLDLDGDGIEERYRATVGHSQRILLDIEFYGVEVEEVTHSEPGEIEADKETGDLVQKVTHYTQTKRIPFSRPWYFVHCVTEPGYGEFFHANPVVKDLAMCQHVYSDLMTTMIEGGKMQAFPTGFVRGGNLTSKVKRYRPGEYHYIPTGVEIQFVSSNYDPSVTPMVLNTIRNDADALIRISQAGVAQNFKPGTTATEAAAVQSGQEEGADEYRDNAAVSGEEMADFIRELAYLHYDQLEEAYGDAWPCSDRELLEGPLRWEAAGKTSDSAPAMLNQNFQDVLAITKDPQLCAEIGLNRGALVKGWIRTKKLPVPDSELFTQTAAMGEQPGMPGMGAPPVPGDPMAQGQLPPGMPPGGPPQAPAGAGAPQDGQPQLSPEEVSQIIMHLSEQMGIPPDQVVAHMMQQQQGPQLG